MDDELIHKVSEFILNEEQLNSFIKAVENTANFDLFLKEDDGNIKQAVELFLKLSAEHEYHLSLLNEEVERLKFEYKIMSGSIGQLEISSDKVKAVERWLKAVEADDEKAILESTQAAAKAIKAIVITGEAFKENKKRKGRPEQTDDNSLVVWAYSEVHCVEAAAVEFKKSTSWVKKERSRQQYLKNRLSSEQLLAFAQEITDGYERKK